MARLTEAEVAGDPSLVRQYTYLLRNRLKIPAKVLIFADDMRPGYYGTHTKSSRVIGPRTPFARDEIALDYGYDSGEEWEGEEDDAGEDVVGDDDEDGGDEDEDDSDADSWLVDDDEVEEVSELPSESSPPPFGDPSMPPPLPKRKNETEEKKDKRRRVVVPLVPFTKGPCWETEIGHSEYEPFNAYRIQLFNG
jgi:chromatin assembly factor 1 subunit A